MALGVTFLPDTNTTHAVLLGCDQTSYDKYQDDKTLGDIITEKLAGSDMSLAHPMLLPALFAEMERYRQIELVRDKTTKLSERLDILAQSAGEHDVGSKDQKGGYSEKKEGTAMIWIELSKLRNGLSDWQTQLHRMIEHVDELNRGEFSLPTKIMDGKHQTPEDKFSEEKILRARREGARIREGLVALVDEYDQYVRECTHLMDGMGLVTQLVIPPSPPMHSKFPGLREICLRNSALSVTEMQRSTSVWPS